uniref:Uncharacterized protein n=1 Tax=Myotis myotis TaxID=51298 RepID=A0A7J7SC57_MYOMY|nr:hypothetical protein mMyoMyo1_009527 [Myotis myotis]
MCFPLLLRVLYQHMRRPQQHRMIPGLAQQAAAGSHEPELDSPCPDGIFSHKKAQLLLVVLKRCQGLARDYREGGVLERAPCKQTLGWVCAHRRFISGWAPGRHTGRKRGRQGWAGQRERLTCKCRINGGFSQPYQRFGAGKASRGGEQAGPDVSCTSHSLPRTFIWEALRTAQGSSHQPRPGHE